MKKVFDKWMEISLVKRILGGLIIGAALGLFDSVRNGNWNTGGSFCRGIKSGCANPGIFPCHELALQCRKITWRRD